MRRFATRPMDVRREYRSDPCLTGQRALVRFFGHVAVSSQHGYLGHYLSRSISDTKHSESRRKGNAPELDELVRSVEGARNRFVALEDLFDDEVWRLQEQFKDFQTKDSKGGDKGRRSDHRRAGQHSEEAQTEATPVRA